MKFAAPRALVAGLRMAIRSRAILRVVVAILVGFVGGACVTAMTSAAESMHVLIYGIPFDQRLSAQARVSLLPALLALCGGGLLLGLVDLWRQRRGMGPTDRPRGGQRAARRSAVAARRPRRRGADRVVERRRRVGRPGGRLCADRLRARLLGRGRPAIAASGFAHAGRRRRGRRDGGGLRRSADRRVLRLRTRHRRLFPRQRRPGAGGRGGRAADGACARRRALFHRGAAGSPLRRRAAHRAGRARARLGLHRGGGDARGGGGGADVPRRAAALLGAAGGGRAPSSRCWRR